MKNRKMLLQVLVAMALVLSLIVPASVVGADEDCYAENAPELMSPADGSVIPADPCSYYSVPFTLIWDFLCDASHYDIQFALDEEFTMPVQVNGEGKAETDYIISGLRGDNPSYSVMGGPDGGLSCETTYYWRVRAVKTVAGHVIQSLWSEPWSFMIAPSREV